MGYDSTSLNKHKYINDKIFNGIDKIYLPEIKQILKRIEELGCGVFGIEAIRNIDKDTTEMYGCEVYESYETECTDSNWYYDALDRLKHEEVEDLEYYITIHVPEDILKKYYREKKLKRIL